MNDSDPLRRAAAMVPRQVADEAGTTVADAAEYLDHREYEIAHAILTGLGDVHSAEPVFWDLLAASAAEMNLPGSEAWCHWRAAETRRGVIRAELRLLGPGQPGARRTAILGGGLLRPLWNIGPGLCIARVWTEGGVPLEPGATGPIRLAPLDPEAWRHLRPGDRITMHEGTPPVGTATVTHVEFRP
ncbi:MAG TPA: hypothetical protein VN408_16405 [Actinoplanes sp.]|nr:hypothetical protein [Actinoplanes sp.]